MATNRRAQVEKAVKDIRAFYRLGRASLKKRPGPGKLNSRDIDLEAERRGINPDTLRKAKQFGGLYHSDEVDQLCRFCREQQSSMESSRPVFGKTHIIRLVSVTRKHERLRLQQQAVVNAWTVRQLQAAIAKRKG